MTKRADLWLRKNRAGKPLHYKWKTVNLQTLDATEARARARLAKAGKWPPPEDKAAAVSVECFALHVEDPGLRAQLHEAIGGAAPDQAAVGAAPQETAGVAGSETAAGAAPADWTQASSAASAEASQPITPEVVNVEAETEAREATNEELAKIVVGVQLWATEQLIKAKVWKNFTAPATPDDVRAAFAAPSEATAPAAAEAA